MLKRAVITAFFCTLAMGSLPSWSETYSWINADGNRVYSDKNPEGEAKHKSESTINYYQPAPAPQKPPKTLAKTQPKQQEVEINSSSVGGTTQSDHDDSDNIDPASKPVEELSEEECQSLYGLSCDRVVNWHAYAVEACGDDKRCADEAFLERKYKPIPTAKLRKLAQRNAARKNRQVANIELFLRQRYTDYCKTREEQLCSKAPTEQKQKTCKKIIEDGCEKDTDIKDILAQYHNLTPAEKQALMAKAKLYNNQQRKKDFFGLLDKALETLITRAILPI